MGMMAEDGTELSPGNGSVSRDVSDLPGLRDAVIEFRRCLDKLEAESAADPIPPMAFYRLRDVALATDEVVDALVSALGAAPQELEGVLETLRGMRNAHVMLFLPRPPVDLLIKGRAAAERVSVWLVGESEP